MAGPLGQGSVSSIAAVCCFLLGCAAGYLIGWRSRGTVIAHWRGRAEVAECLADSFIKEAKKQGAHLRIGQKEVAAPKATEPPAQGSRTW